LDLEERIKKLVDCEEGVLIGFAGLRDVIGRMYGEHTSAVVLGKKLDDGIIDSIISGPNEEYYRLYRETNVHLQTLLRRIKSELSSLHVSSIPIEPTVSDDQLDEEYARTLRTDFSHKMAATRAGIGWIGKTALLVSESFGPRLRLATLLIDRPVGTEKLPIDESRCGACTLCVRVCPAGAANGRAWKLGMEREDFFDPFKCRETCISLSLKNFKKPVSICGICIAVCPVGVKRDSR